MMKLKKPCATFRFSLFCYRAKREEQKSADVFDIRCWTKHRNNTVMW